ncbi:MAG TPA: hemerythrin domain-containing protein [Polyangia bacterium]|nr:hemerythrin domain-containing protein [Polyangia bacterium]
MANTTTDHDQIRKWVEARGGCPARVKRTGAAGDPGILRIDFPGYSGQQSLEAIGWREFFEWFDKNQLALIYQDRTANGKQSRFNKLISRDNAKLPRGKSDGHPRAMAEAPDALELLEMQHRQVEDLFERLAGLRPGDRAFNQSLAEVGDLLAIHASIEEQIFYPSVESRQTEAFLEQAVEDHLQVKRVLATILDNARSRDVAQEIEELAGLTEEHVIEEEMELFPKVRKLFDAAELRDLADEMMQLEAELRNEGNPRLHTRQELEAPASL